MGLLKYSWDLVLKLQVRPAASIIQLRMFASIQLLHQARSPISKGRLLDFKPYSTYTSRFYSTGSNSTHDISSSQIDSLLRREQRTVLLTDSLLARCDISQLASNRPSEDGWFASRLTSQKDGFLFGVLDGHGGEMCMQNVCQRIPDYLAEFLLLEDNISNPSKSRCIDDLFNKQEQSMAHDFLNDQLCQESFKKLALGKRKLQKHIGYQEIDSKISAISKALQHAFLQMDNDLHSEALISIADDNNIDIVPYVTAVQSGACALACYITDHHLFIANTGDCRAVAGVKKQDGTAAAQPLSIDQTAANPDEVTRILSEHPDVEAESLFVNGRLLGILAPLRAFGNAWLKWNISTVKRCFSLLYGPEVSQLIPMFYESPPYLTALPEVTHHSLPLSGFQFLILASDGLWDLLNNEDAVAVVDKYLKTRSRDGIVDNVTLTDNAATALVRHALGGKNQTKLATMLSLPFSQVRLYRDDITVMVIVFNN